MNRRQFIRVAGTGVFAIGAAPGSVVAAPGAGPLPSYLKDCAVIYESNPRRAALKWLAEAEFGLFLHYGLYSLLGGGEWVQFHKKIPVREYEKLKDRFTAEQFDADFITELALAARMKYVNLTTRHHDCFCLWNTKQTDFNSTRAPARRDLVGELAEQCRNKGLGLCLYYSHGRDWRHPHAPNNEDWGGNARPKYDPGVETGYATGKAHDLNRYLDFMAAQVSELLTQYGPIAAIWLDGIAVPQSRREKLDTWRCQELYDLIHGLQPQVLIAYKQGLLGTEDFMAPERNWKGKAEKPLEICDTLQPRGWGYVKADDGRHKSPEAVMGMLSKAAGLGANLLLNSGPLADGAIHSEDVATLREVGRQIEKTGFPVGGQ